MTPTRKPGVMAPAMPEALPAEWSNAPQAQPAAAPAVSPAPAPRTPQEFNNFGAQVAANGPDWAAGFVQDWAANYKPQPRPAPAAARPFDTLAEIGKAQPNNQAVNLALAQKPFQPITFKPTSTTIDPIPGLEAPAPPAASPASLRATQTPSAPRVAYSRAQPANVGFSNVYDPRQARLNNAQQQRYSARSRGARLY